MPALLAESGATKKRKRPVSEAETTSARKSKRKTVEKDPQPTLETEEEILLLEDEILKSRKHYNHIATLLGYCQVHDGQEKISITAAVALCRVFCRLLIDGQLSKPRGASENENTIVQWLRGQLESYKVALIGLLSILDPGVQSTAMTLLLRLLKSESGSTGNTADNHWRKGAFSSLVSRLVDSNTTEGVREEFVEKYLQSYDDLRTYSFSVLRAISDMCTSPQSDDALDNIISMLALLNPDIARKESPDNLYITNAKSGKNVPHSMTAHRKQAQELWLKIIRSNLTKTRRKALLSMVTHHIAPWFNRIELLMDFLSDSFDVGGSTSLTALAGLFHLMQEKNLDYPQFYPKLYSLLDSEVLHSKHRSRFFRLLDTFLSSTHLPAALVASFIKRISRLALFAPPSGIVVVVPWIYNLLTSHPSCTFMIHRKLEHSAHVEGEGMDDPFDMAEPNPMATNAINSSLWEIHTLQSHYHPNVATIAKIISEQFTKQAYNIEDFLDHTYTSMLSAELDKDIKKPPVIEYNIPKKIFSSYEDASQNSLLVSLWDFN
ncbi:MAG: hypothetical protein Q9174_004099 [Haloplaca sp. 1 TL-2023]